MVDLLSVSSLLKLLVFNQKDVFFRYEDIEPDDLIVSHSLYVELAKTLSQGAKADVVRQLCERAEAFRRLNRLEEAIMAATEASQVAHTAYDHNLQGIALLHLGAARASTGRAELGKIAISNSNRAIRDFCLESHNYAIALIVRAQIHYQIHWVNDRETSLSFFRQASRALERIIDESYSLEKTDVHDIYQSLRDSIYKKIDSLVKSSTEIRPLPIVPKQINKSAAPRLRTQDFITETLQALAQRSIPVVNIAATAGTPTGVYPDYSAIDYVESNKAITIYHQPYILHWPENAHSYHRVFRMRQDRDYVVMRVEGDSMAPTLESGEYILVRKQSYHEFDGQLVVATLDNENESAPTKSVVKRARGHPSIRWLESDNSEKTKYPPISHGQFLLYGVVEIAFKPSR